MDTDNTEELTLDEDDNEDSGIDYDFFKDEEENTVSYTHLFQDITVLPYRFRLVSGRTRIEKHT